MKIAFLNMGDDIDERMIMIDDDLIAADWMLI